MSLIEATVEGTIQFDGTLALDNPTYLPAGRVTVVLRQQTEARPIFPGGDNFFQMMDELWAAQRARSHALRPQVEINADRCNIQEQVDDEIEAAIRLQEECRQRRKQNESGTISP